MSAYVYPGYYLIKEAVLSSFTGSIRLDILPLMPRFDILESIYNDSIRGSCMIMDNNGVLDNLPIRGEETISIAVQDALGNTKTFLLSVYKVTGVTPKTNNDGSTYVLHFTSRDRFVAGSRRVIQSFERPISEIAKILFEQYYYRSSKSLVIEPTEGFFRCVIPNYTPMQAMNFLASRAFSSNSQSCSFRFFETSSNFYFCTDEFLIRRFLGNDTEVLEYTYDSSMDQSPEKLLGQMSNFLSLENTHRVNTIEDLYSGSYKSNVIEIDILKRKINNRRYSYNDNSSNYTTTSGNRIIPPEIHSDEFTNTYFTEENERKYLHIRDYTDGGNFGQLKSEQYIPEITVNRAAYDRRMKATSVHAVAHGRLDVEAGDVILLQIPEFSIESGTKPNLALSGRYMVSQISHEFHEDQYKMRVELVKFNVGRSL